MVRTPNQGGKLKHNSAARPAALQSASAATSVPDSADDAQFNTGGFAHIRLLLDKTAAIDVGLVLFVWDEESAKWYQFGTAISDSTTVQDEAVNVLNVGRGVSCYVQLATIPSNAISVGIIGLDLNGENV